MVLGRTSEAGVTETFPMVLDMPGHLPGRPAPGRPAGPHQPTRLFWTLTPSPDSPDQLPQWGREKESVYELTHEMPQGLHTGLVHLVVTYENLMCIYVSMPPSSHTCVHAPHTTCKHITCHMHSIVDHITGPVFRLSAVEAHIYIHTCHIYAYHTQIYTTYPQTHIPTTHTYPQHTHTTGTNKHTTQKHSIYTI